VNPLDVADLVVIAGKTLGLDSQAALDRLDLGAAQTAVSEAAPAADSGDPALAAAALLAALIRHRPWDRDTGPVAVAAATTFLAINGWQADLDPPETAREVIAALGDDRLDVAGLAAWLAPRLSQPPSKEAPMSGWLPGRSKNRRKTSPFQRFSPGARETIVGAQEEARSLRHGYVGTEHLLLGLLRQHDGAAVQALRAARVSPEAARQQVLDIIGHGHQVTRGHIPFTPRSKKVLQLSLREARQLDHMYIGTEHLLLALLHEGQGVACQILTQLGADADTLRQHLAELSGQPETPGEPVAPPGIRDYDLRIAQAQRDKDAALDADDAGQAATARGTEKQLIAERDQLIADWSAGTDVATLGREIDRLRDEVRRLQDLLLRHGIGPEEATEQSESA
jgi:Clp amino terminal domain, pathogenicity island component